MKDLYLIKNYGVQVSAKSMAYAQTYNDHRIIRAEKKTSDVFVSDDSK